MAKIEIDEVLRLCCTISMARMWIARDHQRTMSNVASKVASDNAVPRRSFAVVELLDVSEVGKMIVRNGNHTVRLMC